MAELKPCPFCGSKAHIQESIDKGLPKRYHAVCDDRKCKCPMVAGMPLWRDTKEQAEKDWNTRTPKERGGEK